jgi:D-alanine-D-alanine ligase
LFGKVAVLFGGCSAEREISLKSGRAVWKALLRCAIDAHGIDVGPDLLARLRDASFDRAFVVLHGRGGEDGTVQGSLEVAGFPYTGSGVLGSALAMDKRRTKLLWQAVGIPTPPFQLLRSEEDLLQAAEILGFPLIVKPVHEGSSIGISKATDHDTLRAGWYLARQRDTEVLAERWIEGEEYTAAILDREVLPLIRLETPRRFYDYEAKYGDHAGTRYICPAGLAPPREASIGQLALEAFDAVGASGWGRVDFLCDGNGDPWFLEINTAPGMTDHSLVPMAAEAAGIGFEELVWRILETSVPSTAGGSFPCSSA